jgi:hypothetical protein
MLTACPTEHIEVRLWARAADPQFGIAPVHQYGGLRSHRSTPGSTAMGASKVRCTRFDGGRFHRLGCTELTTRLFVVAAICGFGTVISIVGSLRSWCSMGNVALGVLVTTFLLGWGLVSRSRRTSLATSAYDSSSRRSNRP